MFRPQNPERDAMILNMVEGGQKIVDVARQFGLSSSRVSYIVAQTKRRRTPPQTTTWYRADILTLTVDEVEVVSKSGNQIQYISPATGAVWTSRIGYDSRRTWHQTKQDAWGRLIAHAQQRLDTALEKAREAEDQLAAIKSKSKEGE